MEQFLADAMKILLSWSTLAFAILSVVGMWRVCEKAGEHGWACLVPIYNMIVWLRIAGERWWCLLLYILPGIGIVVHILVMRNVAKRFGKSGLFGIGLAFAGALFFPILGFGRAEYQKAA